MTYTVKIRQTCWGEGDDGKPVEITTTDFLPADMVRIGEYIDRFDTFQQLREKYADVDREICDRLSRRAPAYDSIISGWLVRILHAGDSAHYAVSLAWLLGPDGSTIERIAP